MKTNPMLRATLRTAGLSLLSLLATVGCATEVDGDVGADVLEIDELVEGEGDSSAAELASVDVSEGIVQFEIPDGTDLQAVSKLSSTDVRVMSLNIRIDKTASNLEHLSSRIPRIRMIVDEYSPDIIGIQEGEKDTWGVFERGMNSDYGWVYHTRGGVKTPNELVAIMYKASRFERLEYNSITVERKERRDEGDCPNNPGWGNRTVQRVKLRDKLTNEILDVFNTHFPAGDECEKQGMARITRAYVRKFGDNALLMGDFNTGISKTGSRNSAYNSLTHNSENSFLMDTYVEKIGIGTSGQDQVAPHGHSYITDKTNEAYKRLGNKIDHIFTAPAFAIKKAGIDRSLFRGTSRYDCRDENSTIDSLGYRTHCQGRTWNSYDVASDHWAIWADVNRISCTNSDCAASH